MALAAGMAKCATPHRPLAPVVPRHYQQGRVSKPVEDSRQSKPLWEPAVEVYGSLKESTPAVRQKRRGKKLVGNTPVEQVHWEVHKRAVRRGR